MSQTQTVTAASSRATAQSNRSVRTSGRPVAPSRQYDHIYDPNYHVSAAAHNRQEAAAMSRRTVVVPDANNMFSDLRHHPRATLRLDNADPVPRTMARDHGVVQQQYHAKQAHDLAVSDHRGRDLLVKYHQQGVQAIARPNAPNVVLESLSNRVDPLVAARVASQRANTEALQTGPSTRTIGTQSIFRESETQTDPWTSEYTVRPGSAPEVLTLMSLTHQHGLPAGLNEVIMIERARAKRKWEASLPDIADESKRVERMKMMEEQEALEWKWREEEIEQIQQRRLELVAGLMENRATQHDAEVTQRLEATLARRRDDRDDLREKSQKAGLRELRSLQQKREAIDPTSRRRPTLVDKYANPGSQVYAPIDRDGGSLHDANPERFEVRSRYTETYDGLLDLENWMPAGITNPRIRAPRRGSGGGSAARGKQKYQDKLGDLLTTFKAKSSTAPEPPRFQRRIPTPPARGPIRSVAVPDAKEEKRKQAVLLLQRLLRGRAEQASMFEGKELRMALVEELRSTHALEREEQQMKETEKAEVERLRREAAEAEATSAARNSALQDVAGRHAGQSLDFLSKELVRLQEERRIQAFAMLAERERRLREAEEGGRRAKEEARRQQTDEVFRQIVGVHQDCVDSFLENILIEATDTTAENVARREIREKARAIDRVAEELHASGADTTPTGAMAIADDLVSTFLLPEAEKIAMRSVTANKQKKFQVAAHKELVDAMGDVERGLAAARRASRASSAVLRPSSAIVGVGDVTESAIENDEGEEVTAEPQPEEDAPKEASGDATEEVTQPPLSDTDEQQVDVVADQPIDNTAESSSSKASE